MGRLRTIMWALNFDDWHILDVANYSIWGVLSTYIDIEISVTTLRVSYSYLSYPSLQRSWKGYTVRPSVRLWTNSCLLCISHNIRRSHFIFTYLINQPQQLSPMLGFKKQIQNVNFADFLLQFVGLIKWPLAIMMTLTPPVNLTLECVYFLTSRGIPDCFVVSLFHYSDVIMGAMASQITSLTIVYLIVYSGADQRKHESSASLVFVWGIHRSPVNSRTNGQ